ncbi:MAG: methylated-DNA--[protein]-cysteine S-methyltransferase [Treponema sp.]|jgi:methylated-DNA-[protein]-cysteine S-methyltransferase|nr:methylated-DNA--[protein]-cysteine S-methyltransferase [Treponema sp.]
MLYTSWIHSALGKLLLASDGTHLTGLWLEGQKYFATSLTDESTEKPDLPLFAATQRWIDDYFAGKKPAISALPLAPAGSDFRKAVWDILCTIPYGQTITYGEIAKKVATQRNESHMSSQAVGGAVGHNPISIIIPCHRVVGANGSLTGYAGGIDKKIKLLELESTKPFSYSFSN